MNDHRAVLLEAYARYYPTTKTIHKTSDSHLVHCCFHNEDTPSMYIYQNHVHCYGCGYHASAVEFVRCTRYSQLGDSEGYRRAYADLGETKPMRYNGAIPRRMDIHRWKSEATKEEGLDTDVLAILKLAQAKYNECLANLPNDSDVKKYAHRRGLLDSFGMPKYGVGYGAIIGLKNFLDEPERAMAVKTHLLTPELHETMFGRLIIPDFDGCGNVVWLTGRAVPSISLATVPKYLNLSLPKPLFGSWLVARNDHVIVVEGVMCVLALRGLGMGAVALNGKSLSEKHLAFFLGKHVSICLDNPICEKSPGDTLAAVDKITAQLKPYAASLDYIALPEGIKDISEFVERFGHFELGKEE